MTEPSDPEGAPPAQPGTPPPQSTDAPLPGESPLDAYVRQNHLRYSEAALRQALLAAGNSSEAVDRALARHRGDPGTVGAGRRSARVLLLIYLAGFGLLSVAMLANAARIASDTYGSIGLVIVIWAIVVAAGYGASMLWVASRRLGLILVGVIVTLFGLGLAGNDGIAGEATIIAGLALVGAAIVFGQRIDRGMSTSLPVMLSVPVLILLALGGACVATGLPFGNF